jgi:hypothetical protein
MQLLEFQIYYQQWKLYVNMDWMMGVHICAYKCSICIQPQAWGWIDDCKNSNNIVHLNKKKHNIMA